MRTSYVSSESGWPSRSSDRRLAYEYLPTNDEHWQAALSAQRELARAGRHRAVGVHDLMRAVLAAAHNLTVVHYDSDFETAATVLAFEHRWVLPRGTLLGCGREER
jgi:predicted nucleic acid-binding protein